MSDQEVLFPLEFFIEETPKSLQAGSRSREEWKKTVKAAADFRIKETADWVYLDNRRLAVTIFYFAPEEMEGDIDNIIKPILDGMICAAYIDDSSVERVLVQKFEPGIEKIFKTVTERLAAALEAEAPVVYVRVDDDLSWRSL